MCDARVTEAVKQRMLEQGASARRAPISAPTAALHAPPSRIVDLTHTLHADFPTYDDAPGYSDIQLCSVEQNGFNLKNVSFSEHTGTHMDAPLHYTDDGASVDEIPVEQLICPLAIVDIRSKSAENADAALTPDDLKAWIAAHGDIPDGACVALYSGWDALVDTPKFRNADSNGAQHYPGFHGEAAQMLLEETGAIGLAVDTLSLDIGASTDFAAHTVWLPSGRWGLECVANLGELPPKGATILVGAPKHQGGTGGPCRLFGLV
ncbi:MAG: cyclase family protein [Neomegalonema sp.]|nr:cyclase family protein [Neomegalonema sp.]